MDSRENGIVSWLVRPLSPLYLLVVISLFWSSNANAGISDCIHKITISSSAETVNSKRIDCTYTAIPKGLSRGSSALLESLYGETYGIVEFTSDANHMLWLQKRLGYNARGEAKWAILSILSLPPIDPNELVVFGRGVCSLNGITDSEIIAIVKETKNQIYESIRLAWKAHRHLSRFESIPNNAVTCLNIGYRGE